MATYDAVIGGAASTVRDWLSAVGREFGLVVGIAFAGVMLAAAVALVPWPMLDDRAGDPSGDTPPRPAPAQKQ